MASSDASDIVGCRVSCTFCGKQVEGTVFAYNLNLDLMTIVIDPVSDRPTFKIMKLSHISNITMADPHPQGPKALPSHVAAKVQLPSLGDAAEFKKLKQKVKDAEARRPMNENASIAATDVFDYLGKIFNHDVAWEENAQSAPVVVVLGQVVVDGSDEAAGGWMTPAVTPLQSGDDCEEMIARVKRVLQGQHKKK